MKHVSLLLLGLLSTEALAAPLLNIGGAPAGFQIFSVDDKGGGWVIHHMKGRGDTLWGCKDLAAVDECTQVYFNDWKTATKLEFLHVGEKSQTAWLKLTAPAMGDVLLACKDPEATPACTVVELELRPALSSYERIWPGMPCDAECGGVTGGAALPEWHALRIIEPDALSTMWLQTKVPAVGPVNLYACRDLAAEAKCELVVPNWLALDREDLGFKKLVDIENEAADGTVTFGPGVTVDDVDEGSVAWDAGLREGMVITKVGGFETNKATHARYLMLQFPAEDAFMVTLSDGREIELKPRRKPAKK
jgi:hypothetical protein